MTDNARGLSMHEMRDICKRDSIKLHFTVPYHPASNGVAKRMIGALTNAVRAGHSRVQVGCHGLGIFLVQPISPFRAMAKGKAQGRVKTYKDEPWVAGLHL